tara:strand:- start:1255 stop:1770 length:516 start_codon:yes stop_codon:yes gene_type:complete
MTSKLKVNLINDSGDNNIITSDGSGNLTTQKILQPSFFVKLSSNQSIPNNTNTKVTFDSEVFDTNSAFASNKFTVPASKAGKYFFSFGLLCNGLDDGDSIQVALFKNGSNANFGFFGMFAGTGNSEQKFTSSTVLDLSASDYIELYVQHFEGGAMDINANNTFLTGFRIGS